ADADIKSLTKKSFEMEKAGKQKSPEYQEVRNELQAAYEKKHLTKASIFEKQGNNQAAVKEYQELLKKPSTNPELKNELLMKTASNYTVLKNYDAALKSAHEAADIAVKSGNNTLLAKNLMVTASVF